MNLTPRVVAYVAREEGLVLEAYKDSVGVWTWALGVTNASGHEVHPRYKDNPQTLARCIAVSVWLMRERYLPAVETAFKGHDLTEAQLAAALGFHWNTGAILSAQWVRDFRDGKPASARANVMNYRKPASLIERRRREQALFFDGVWPSLRVPVYPVAKPSYSPQWSKAQVTDLLPAIEGVMA